MLRQTLVVNADDFGLSPGVNRGVLMAHEQGIVTSASVMVRLPGAQEAASLARAHPSLGVGLHLDVGEWRLAAGEWQPVYLRVDVTDANALARECRAQLRLFEDLFGAKPTHVDSHQHAHTREPLRSIAMAMAQELGIPLRHFSTAKYVGDFFGRDETGSSLSERLTPTWLAALLGRLNTPVTELCCHPAAVVDFDSDYGDDRLLELRALCSDEVRAAAQQDGIDLASFRYAVATRDTHTTP